MRVTVSPEQIHSAFEAVKDDPSFDESRGLWERGRPPVEMIQAMCLRPGDPARIRRVRGLRLPRWAAGATGQGAGHHHGLEVERLPVLHEFALRSGRHRGHRHRSAARHRAQAESLVPRERIAIAYTRAVMTRLEPHPGAAGARAARAFHRPGGGRADVPHRLHQHAEPVQQRARASATTASTASCAPSPAEGR